MHGRKFRVLIRLGAGWSCAAAGSENVKVFGCPNGPCGYDAETILRYMAELNILGSLWLAGICRTSVGVFLANQASTVAVFAKIC